MRTFQTTFDTYNTTEQGSLGSGDNGHVFRVTNSDDKPFALKILHATMTRKQKRFRNEIEFCKRAIHPNIVQVLDEGFEMDDTGKHPFYVMPEYQGTLRHPMNNKELTLARMLRFLSNMLDAVEAAHIYGVWHRDIKPENFLFDSN